MQKLFSVVLLALVAVMIVAPASQAASGAEIDARVNATLAKFSKEVAGGKAVIAKAKGILVMPRVYKAGFGFGGEFGEGALRINGKTADYYNVVSASYGFQIGAQKKSVIIAFMDDTALNNFRNSAGWEVGADASVALITVGAEETVSSDEINKPIVGFVIGQKGLMAGVSLEGAKFNKLSK